MINFLSWPVRAVGFLLYFIWLLIRSNVSVGWDVVTPGSGMEAGIVRLPLRCRTDLEITMLANLISLTPGTLTLSVSHDPPELYVHGMYAPDAAAFRAELYDLERRMLIGMRRYGDAGELPAQARRLSGGAP
ncbi:Na+/H+ antiporter subunit E [Haloechinothrix sp. LS1_15]|uniref:Na+/H+ antiporter subunit E n=1 Tax=Haloechinothrix sp. LS1_15 TaxID=2652248 RepID=UPI002943FA6B|nr:Na+/H+ antiporter subunit E [Haloechinothrix sp. LS1_15]MDV6011350.1 Na+/H+ antiporter subunit E [Haloechinothrix sp. LS1_15]